MAALYLCKSSGQAPQGPAPADWCVVAVAAVQGRREMVAALQELHAVDRCSFQFFVFRVEFTLRSELLSRSGRSMLL
jgi:hypothetical protein